MEAAQPPTIATFRQCRGFMRGIIKLGGVGGRYVKPNAAIAAAEFDRHAKVSIDELIAGCLARGWIETTGKGVTVTDKGRHAMTL